MDAEDFESEELLISESVGLTFHGLNLGSSDSRMRRASPGEFQGISPVSNGTCLRFVIAETLEPPGETESGSAGTQPDKGYSGSGAPMARQAPDGFCHQGLFS